jgi:hypothetical protein
MQRAVAASQIDEYRQALTQRSDRRRRKFAEIPRGRSGRGLPRDRRQRLQVVEPIEGTAGRSHRVPVLDAKCAR